MNENDKIWGALGLKPQVFPIYYNMGPTGFVGADGQPSGAAGARASLSKEISNFPHLLYGIRIENTYELPDNATEAQIAYYEALKQFTDGEQTVRISLAQQNITANETVQTTLCGSRQYWHPFASPFPMAGGNTVECDIQRITGYGAFPGLQEQILPQVHVTLVAVTFRGDMSTMAPHRVGRP